jgi:hypothetical protein
MKIRFLKEQFIECCIGFDEDEEPIMEEEKVLQGGEFEIEVLNEDDEIIGVEFGNGTVSFLNKEDIEIED